MAPATKESTRQQRVQALSHLNAALEDLDKLKSQDAIDLNTVQARTRAVNVAHGRFVGWHNKFLGFPCEEAAMNAALAESMVAFEKFNSAKEQFLALKTAISGRDPSAPPAEIPSQRAPTHPVGVDPKGDADEPNPGSASSQPVSRE